MGKENIKENIGKRNGFLNEIPKELEDVRGSFLCTTPNIPLHREGKGGSCRVGRAMRTKDRPRQQGAKSQR